MKYLVWRAQVKKYIEENYNDADSWESWVTWRDLYIKDLSALEAAKQGYETKMQNEVASI